MLLGFGWYYWVVLGICVLLGGWAAAAVRGAFAKYSRFPTRAGRTGAEVARRILRDHGIHDVKVEPVRGRLSDHYDPSTKTLRLSEPVYHETSMAAVGVAAHEVGHAIQHAHGYAPLQFRSAWVPVASTGSGISMLLILIALVLGGASTAAGAVVGWLGLLAFGTMTLFTLVTLPVEFDASRRALLTLESGGYMTPQELDGARSVLRAAAMTYVAAAVSSLLMLLYWAQALGLLGGSRE